MTATPLTRAARIRIRVPVVVVLVVVLTLTGTGVATARWIIAATTTTPVVAASLTTGLTGTADLGASNIQTTGYTTPVALTLHNPNPAPVDYTLTFTPESGTLSPAETGLAVWEPAGTTCSGTVPESGVVTGTLAAPPSLQVSGAPGGAETVVCAATRFTGTLFGSAGKSLTAIPTLTASLTTGTWTATDTGTSFTHAMAPAPNQVADLQCEEKDDLLGLLAAGVELSWSPVPEATGYQVTSSTGGTIRVSAPTVQLAIENIGEADWVEVTALGPTGGSAPVTQHLETGPVLLLPLLGDALRCPS